MWIPPLTINLEITSNENLGVDANSSRNLTPECNVDGEAFACTCGATRGLVFHLYSPC